MKSNNILAALVAATVIGAPSLAAANVGFAPWHGAVVASEPDAVQAQVEIKPFGVEPSQLPGFSAVTSAPDAEQVRIDIKPFYLR